MAAAYGVLMLCGIAASLGFWWRASKKDGRLVVIYFSALLGALFGAKAVYLLAEGWLHVHDSNRWTVLATGKSVLGALLGGYLTVEIAKRVVSYPKATGDLFAFAVPIGVMFGRVGSVLHGCCAGEICSSAWFTVRDSDGVPRWPAAQMEFLFNFGALVFAALASRHGLFRNQLFHLYLIGYGIFRFIHEFARDTPRVVGPWTGYQIAAVCVTLLGVTGFAVRAKAEQRKVEEEATAVVSI